MRSLTAELCLEARCCPHLSLSFLCLSFFLTLQIFFVFLKLSQNSPNYLFLPLDWISLDLISPAFALLIPKSPDTAFLLPLCLDLLLDL